MREKARGMLNETLGVHVMLQHVRVFSVVIFFKGCVCAFTIGSVL